MTNFQELYEKLLLSKYSGLIFWADQGSFLCWLLGHDDKFFSVSKCERCSMSMIYFANDHKYLIRHGLFLKWHLDILLGKLSELLLKFF